MLFPLKSRLLGPRDRLDWLNGISGSALAQRRLGPAVKLSKGPYCLVPELLPDAWPSDRGDQRAVIFPSCHMASPRQRYGCPLSLRTHRVPNDQCFAILDHRLSLRVVADTFVAYFLFRKGPLQ